jgi:hypothetical protein
MPYPLALPGRGYAGNGKQLNSGLSHLIITLKTKLRNDILAVATVKMSATKITGRKHYEDASARMGAGVDAPGLPDRLNMRMESEIAERRIRAGGGFGRRDGRIGKVEMRIFN